MKEFGTHVRRSFGYCRFTDCLDSIAHVVSMGEVRNSRPSNTSGLACPESIRICTHVHSRYSLKWTCLAVWFCAALRIPLSTLLLSSPIPVPGQFLQCEQFFVLLMVKSVISFHMHLGIDYYYWRFYMVQHRHETGRRNSEAEVCSVIWPSARPLVPRTARCTRSSSLEYILYSNPSSGCHLCGKCVS